MSRVHVNGRSQEASALAPASGFRCPLKSNSVRLYCAFTRFRTRTRSRTRTRTIRSRTVFDGQRTAARTGNLCKMKTL